MAPAIGGNSFYTIVDGPSWTQAEANAVKLGGHLVAINDAMENQYLINMFQDTYVAGDVTTYYKWIGFTDSAQEGVWRWTNGDTATFTNWSGPNPDNNTDWTSPNGQDYAAIQWYGGAYSGDWDDKSDLSQYFAAKGIAEIPLSYSISKVSGEVKEGAAKRVDFQINIFAGTQDLGETLADGLTINWQITGITEEDLDFTNPEGIYGMNGQQWVRKGMPLYISNAFKVDADIGENYEISVFLTAPQPKQIGTKHVVKIAEAFNMPTYTLTAASSINEGSTLTTLVATTDVSSGTTLYYLLSGTGITSADFASGALIGSGLVGSNGTFSFAHTIANDLTTEGTETLNIKLFTDSTRQTQVGSTASVSINDTSAAITTIINNNSFTTINNITNTTTNNNYVYINSNNTINNTWNTVLIDNSVNIRDVISQWFPTSASISQSQALTDTKFFDISAST